MKTIQKIAILFFITVTGFTVGGCDYMADNKPFTRDEDVTPGNTELAESKAKLEEQERVYTATLAEIELNLQEITTREGIILAANKETGINSKSEKIRILENIKAINELVIDNHNKIADLKEDLRKNRFDRKELTNRVTDAEAKVREFEEQVGDLKRQLAESDYRYAEVIKQIDAMAGANKSLMETLDWYDNELNTAYYKEGTAKELKQEGIVSRKGDLLGLGGAKVLNSDLEPTNFTRINVHETTVIPVNAKKAKLVTGHEEGSYEFVKEGDMIAAINIIDPAEFWKSSKYMVLETR